MTAEEIAPEVLAAVHPSHFRNTRRSSRDMIPSPETIQSWFRYENRLMRWNVSRGAARVDDVFGGRRWTTIGGITNFPVLEIAWCFHHGHWPLHAVRPKNGRFAAHWKENLYLDERKPSFVSQLV